MRTMKYCIEIGDLENPCEYILQSKWFDTEEQALEWTKGILFWDNRYTISLMRSEWDSENDTYKDIEFVRYLK